VDFWLDDLESVNKEPKFPKVPRTRGRPISPEFQALHNIARRIRPLVRGSLVRGIRDFQKNIDLNDLADAISRNNAQDAFDVVPWEDFRGAIKGVDMAILEGVSDSAAKSKFLFRQSIKKLIPTLRPDVVFNADNPAIRSWIDSHIGELVQNVQSDTQKGIQRIIADSMNAGLPPRTTAKSIKEIIGLNDRQVQAVINRRAALVGQGVKGARLEDIMSQFTLKQLKYRSETIARTEAMTANNRGLLEVANQNADKGLYDRKLAQKEWIVTPYDRVCRICRPMAGAKVGIDEDFYVAKLGINIAHPPAHPNCNCGWAVVLLEGAV